MPSATRLFARSTLIMAAAAVALMFAVPAAFAKSCPRALVFAVQPTTTQVQTTMTPAVVVDVENSQGYLATNFDGSVTLSYGQQRRRPLARKQCRQRGEWCSHVL